MQKNKYDKKYIDKVNKQTPSTPVVKNCLCAFLFGGLLCAVAEVFYNYLMTKNNNETLTRMIISICLIVLTAILTGIGVYDKIAAVAGAGLSVPISGFANSVCSPAIEYAAEGHILGTSEKMFSLAGAVIVYGCSLASLYGMIYYFFIR